MRRIKKILIILLLIVILPVLTFIVLYRFTPVVDQGVEKLINHFSGENLEIRFARLSGNLLGTLRIEDLMIRIGPDTIRIPQTDLDYDLLDIVGGRYFVERAYITEPLAVFHQKPPDTTASTAIDSLVAAIVTSLPAIRLDQVVLENGAFRYITDQSTQIIENINIDITGQALNNKIVLQPRYARAYWKNRDIPLRNLSFKLIGSKSRVTLNQFQAKLDDIDVIGNGEVEFEPEFRILMFLDTTTVNRDFIAKFSDDLPFKKGFMRVYSTYIGTVEAFSGEIYVDGQMDDINFKRFFARYSRSDRGFNFDELQLRSNVGDADGSAFLSRRFPNQIDLQARQLDLRRLGVSRDTMLVSGIADLNFENWRWETLKASGTVGLDNFQYGNIKVDSVLSRIRIQDQSVTVLPSTFVKLGPGAKIAVQGHLTADQQIGLTISSGVMNLDTLFSRLGLPMVGGSGQISLTTSGPVRDPSIKGRVDADSITVGQAVFYALHGDYDVGQVVGKRLGEFNLETATSYIGDVFLTSGELNLKFNGNDIRLEPISFYSEDNAIVNRGLVSFVDGGVKVDISEFLVRYDTYRVNNKGALRFSYINDSLKIDQFSLVAGDQGELEIEGFFAAKEESALGATVANFPLLPLNQYIYWEGHSIAGNLNADAQFLGRLDNPEVNLFVDISDLNIDENRIGALDGDFTLADSIFSINYFNFERDSASFLTINGRVDIQLVGRDSLARLDDTPLDLNIVVENLRIEDYLFFYRSTYPVAGKLSGRLDLVGTIGDPIGNLELTGNDFRYADYVFPELQLNDTWIQKTGIELRNAKVNFLDTEIQIRAEKPFDWSMENPQVIYEDKRFSLQARIDEDSLNFLNALNPELDRLIGKINADIALDGEWDNPVLQRADINIRNGTLFLSRLENGIGDLDISANMNGNVLQFTRIKGVSPRVHQPKNFLQSWFTKLQRTFIRKEPSGQIDGRGSIDFTDLSRPKLDFTVSANKAYFNYFLENVEVVASTDRLRVTGRDTIAIDGEVLVRWGDMEVDFVESEKNLLLTTTVREKPPYLKYNLDVTILPDFHVRSADQLNDFNLTIGGELSVIQEPRSLLEIFGVLQISDGKYAVQGEEFNIENGTINFVNPKELPDINLYAVAVKHIDAVEDSRNPLTFELQVTGNVDEPDKKITIRDASGTVVFPDVKDQMALLLLGVPFSELGNAGFLTKGGEIVTQALVNRIEKEARSFTGLDEVRVDNANSFFNSRLNQQSTISFGKYLTSNLYLEYKSQLAGQVPTPQLSWEAGNQISLQYRLNRGLYLSTLLKKTEEGNEKVKFDISWQFDF